MLAAAQDARNRAYAPYSGFRVGAACVSANGDVFSGVNVENASFGLTMCAEMSAVAAAASAGAFDQIREIGLVAGDSVPPKPCGRCRQIIHEMAERAGHDIAIVCATADLERVKTLTISELLPDPFGPADLRA